MQIHAKYQDKILYIELKGEVDEHNAAVARKIADRMIEEYALRSEKGVFDLRQISFMDSTGIGFLIGRYKTFRRFGVPVYITQPSVTTDRILSMSGVYSLMPKV